VCPVVVAEIRASFKKESNCQNALSALGISMDPFTEESALLAGSIFSKYFKKGGPRKTILPDFLVAAHASKQASMLATTDRGYFRAYFPKLRLMSL
jgi:predicted nucleic acid-binding protein